MYFFSENRLSQKDAKLYACLISWLGACLQVRCPVWRLHVQLTKEHSTRAPHKRAQHARATQKETHGEYTRELDMTKAIEMGLSLL